MALYRSLAPLSRVIADIPWPVDFFAPENLPAFLDNIYVQDYEIEGRIDGFLVTFWLAMKGELSVSLPGLDSVKLVAGSGGVADYTFVTASLVVGAESSLTLHIVTLALRFDPSILKPAALSPGDPVQDFVEIQVTGSVQINSSFDVTVDGFDALKLTPAMIGNSGIVISADDVKLDLSRTSTLPEIIAAGFDESFMGIYIGEAKVQFPKDWPAVAPRDLFLRRCVIGSGGISGELTADYTPNYNSSTKEFTGDGAGKLFGIPFGLEDVSLKFKQNAFLESKMTGQLLLTFFDRRLRVEIGLSLDGGFAVKLASAVEPGDLMNGGLLSLKKQGLLDLTVESLSFQVQDSVFTTKLSGRVTPRFGDLDWPSFQVKELVIDSEGNVRLEGGWLDLREQYSLDFHGFQMEITKLGFGKTEDGGKWIGFAGGLKLVDGLSIGASVEGLRITWYEDEDGNIVGTRMTFSGIGVEFEVPEVLRFKGAVSYDQTSNEFAGDIKLDLISLDLQVDGKLVFGQQNGATYMAIYLAAELPSGIPLWSTGLALYGMAGLFALDMEPDKGDDQEWYGVGGENSWYHTAPTGVTALEKWRPEPGSLALGAGVTIGTVSDNGYAFSGRMLLVIVFPGPILLIEGKANLLKERAKLDGPEPNFRALAVLDNRAGTFLIGLDARYTYDRDGRLIDIRGSAEAFFDFDDASLWHLYLGEREPREKRLRAEIFQLFESNTYFMLDAHQLAMGAWVGYDKHWKFGPLRVMLEAWIEGNALVSWKPNHFYGDLWLHGKAELAVWRFDTGLTVDAHIAADVFDPFHLLGEFSVGIGLPWPLPDFEADITLEWGPELIPPPLPLPLQEIAVEHFKVTTTWPLPRKVQNPNPPPAQLRLLLPDYDTDNDGFRQNPDTDPAVIGGAPPPDLTHVPVVPLDCRPHLTFGRAVHDEAKVGGNPQPPEPAWERIGDPAKNKGPVRVRYSLKKVALDKWDTVAGIWEPVAWSPNPDDETKLSGSWAPVPAMPDGGGKAVAQTKLWIWSKTPFDYTRHTGRAWDEWFTDHFPDYPCVPEIPDREICCDFEAIDPNQALTSPWQCPDYPGLVLRWFFTQVQMVTVLDQPIEGLTHALCFPGGAAAPAAIIELGEPARAVTITLVAAEGTHAIGYDTQGNAYGPFFGGLPDNPHIEVKSENLIQVVVLSPSVACILQICLVLGPDPDEVTRREEMEQHLRDEIARWSQVGTVLEPHSIYRIKVVTNITAEGEGELAGHSQDLDQTEYAYFRTEGPPGLTKLSVPVGHSDPDEFESGLDDLTPYVHQTVPATIPNPGEKPSLPRPVYRAYDVGVAFNEDYIDLMYRIERRDLGLYLYDNNNRPVRDAQGRLIILSNRWGATEELTLTESAQRWITVVNASDCATLDPTIIPHEKTLTSAAEGQVLDPDTVYETRLVPLLLHEDFGTLPIGASVNGPSGTLDGWTVHDDSINDEPSHWEIREAGTPPSRHIAQTANIGSGARAGTDPVKPGTMLLRANRPDLPADHPDQPGHWTNYRLSVYLRSTDDDAIGIVFRYIDADHYYRFSMDRQRTYRRVVRVVDGVHTIVAEDDFVYRQDQDYLITVEAIGSSLRVYQDGALVFDVADDSMDRGRIGLYCWRNMGARFSDVRVDDFRLGAPIVYRFQFTTSQFANFFHHLHSFQDETWHVELTENEPPLSEPEIAALVGKAATPTTTPSDDEARAYQALAEHVLGPAARQNPPEVQVTRVARNGEALALLIQSPEPIDWSRTDLVVLRAERQVSPPELPGAVKLTNVTFGTTQPNEESVTLLLREAVDLTGHRLEYRRLPGPIAESTGDPVLFVDEFDGTDSGLLFREGFGPNALDHYIVVDEGTNLGPSTWAVSDGHIVQTSNIYGGSVSGAVPDKPGTMAMTGSASWDNVRISTTLRSTDDDAIGLVFRYQDANHYYRFSMDRERSYRRLTKKVGDAVTVLWEEHVAYTLDRPYRLVIDAYDGRLLGYLDDIFLFSVQDPDIETGRVGLYCWANTGAHFEALEVETLDSHPLLWQPAFADLSELEIVDEPDAIQGPSEWAVVDGVLIQSSDIHMVDDTPHRPGTYALGGRAEWQDVQLSVQLRSDDDGAIGIMFRVLPQVGPSGEAQGHNYYRFSMDRAGSYRWLVKKVGETVTVLWQDTEAYTVGQTYHLALRAVGSELRGYLDGVLLFTTYDSDLTRGQIGFYCSANTGARFERVLVNDRTRRAGRWLVHDEGTVNAPSVWRHSGGTLLQTSNISSGNPSGTDPVKPGTHAVAGNSAWNDYRLTVRMRSDDNDAIGVMFRYVDGDHYYQLSLDAQRYYRRLIKREHGAVTTLWEEPGGYTVGEPFTLTVDAIGSRLVGYIGDVRLFDLTDSAHVAGQVGLYCWSNTGARFERVEVRRPPLEAYALLRDRFANNDTSGWSFVDEGTLDAPSNWVIFEGTLRQTSNIYGPPNDRNTLDKKGTQAVVGDPAWTDVVFSARLQSLDNDAIGLLFRYTDEDHYYRFSMDSQRGYRRLVKNVGGTFSLLWEDDFAYEVGRTYEITIVANGSTLRGYLDGVLMFAVEDSDLAAGRIGLYCWGNDDSRFSNVQVYPADRVFDDWLLDEPFDVLIPGRWTFVDEGDQQGPSQWEVTTGELRQTSNIYGGSSDGSVPDKPGTYALAGDPNWTDYRVSVRLSSDDDDAIGVMFRYADAQHYYRFSMDHQRSYRRLIKKVAGAVTVLWEDTVQYAPGREYVLSVDCMGERLTAYLDGVPLFSVEDNDLTAGRIGLYCWRNTGARFAEVRVAAPAWITYYTFGREERLPAGTQVRIYAGNMADVPPEAPGVIRRFIAALDERGHLRLPTESAELRLRRSDGTSGHMCHFLPHTDYASIEARVLRKVDDTGFFIVVPAAVPVGSHLAVGQYRLKMTYRRDNRAVAPDSIVFRQAGVTDPEQVTIDIPWMAH